MLDGIVVEADIMNQCDMTARNVDTDVWRRWLVIVGLVIDHPVHEGLNLVATELVRAVLRAIIHDNGSPTGRIRGSHAANYCHDGLGGLILTDSDRMKVKPSKSSMRQRTRTNAPGQAAETRATPPHEHEFV